MIPKSTTVLEVGIPMKRAANFIVNRRYLVLTVMLLLTAVCAVLMPQVEVNTDMTRYLPDDSSMKRGMDVMEQEFPGAEITQTIRVMFQDLDGGQQREILAQLEALPHVDSVDFDPDHRDYSRENHTLYILHTVYDYGSQEERSIEAALQEEFTQYHMTFKNDNTSSSDIPLWILVLAVAILMAILFVMCSSWVEPLLFLAAIGAAIVINLGTNIFMGSISNTTYAMAAILQLVLSMDYSIILMNRYRQELLKRGRGPEAMKAALKNAFSSIASSSVTTIVGLLALVFMRFKIGMDLGIVLAKGVLISMVCIFTLLPGLILMFDKLIQKTAKRELTLHMGGVGQFSYRFRRVIAGVFLLLFTAAALLQANTQTVYTLMTDDPIAEVFPPSNAIVMVYDNRDETQVTELAEKLTADPHVKSSSNYSNTLGKPCSAGELAEALGEMEGGAELDSDMLNLIYYDYFTGGALPALPLGDFLHFVARDVAEDETFSPYLDGDIRENVETLEKFADRETLTRPMGIQELADFFSMDAGEVKQILLYFYTQTGGGAAGTMTLPAFSDFVLNEVAANPEYASLFDRAALSQMRTLATFTDAGKMTALNSCGGIASLLGMDREAVTLLFVYYYALSGSYQPEPVSLPDFAEFMREDVAKNPAFAPRFDRELLEQMDALAQYTDREAIQQQLSSAQLAAALGMDSAMVEQLFQLRFGGGAEGHAMSLPEFTGFLVNSVLPDERYAGFFDEAARAQLSALHRMVSAAASGQPYPASQLSSLTGLDAAFIESLFAYQSGATGQEVSSMTLPAFLDFLLNDIAPNELFSPHFDQETLERLDTANVLTQAAASGQAFTAGQLAQFTGVDEGLTGHLFLLYFGGGTEGETMSMEQFVDFLLSDVVSNQAFSPYFDQDTVDKLSMAQAMMRASLSGAKFTSAEMADLLGMDGATARLLYTYRASPGELGSWRLSVQTAVNFLVKNSGQMGSMLGSGELKKLAAAQRIINGSVAGTAYASAELAGLMGMGAGQARELFLLYTAEHGDTSGWQISAENFVDFLVGRVLTDSALPGGLDGESVQALKSAKTLIDAVVSGKAYEARELSAVLKGLGEDLDENTVELLYLYYASTQGGEESWKLSLKTLADHLTGSMAEDPRFAQVLDGALSGSLDEMEKALDDGVRLLVGPNYSRLMLNTTLPSESHETTAFFDRLTEACDETLQGNYYLIGNSAMNYEMGKSFRSEMLLITLLTAAAIFLVVALTFRSLVVPAILVLIVQCGVYITITAIGLQGYSIYYLALLIVQCILMGATIDYGILFTTYYREKRQTMEAKDALTAAYDGSIHTILTSGLIMILVTGIIGYCFSDPTIGQICRTISIGALSATLLILFVLPGLLAALDRLLTKRR